jgi:acetyl esterase/lipase
VAYCKRNGVALKMDIYFPKQAKDVAMPIVVYVHGGGWIAGSKGRGPGMSDTPALLERGFVVAAVNYRLAPKYKFPVQIEDVKCAIRFLRAHALPLHIDPKRIGAWGSSAGGHLVALLGLTDASAGFDVGEYLDQSSRVQAVVDMFGPTNLMTWSRGTNGVFAKRVFGITSKDDPMLARGSPVTYVSKDAPPFLILQGEKDGLVPPSQSQELYDRLKEAGANVNLVMVKNAGHAFTRSGGKIDPSRADLTKMIADFFDKNLR